MEDYKKTFLVTLDKLLGALLDLSLSLDEREKSGTTRQIEKFRKSLEAAKGDAQTLDFVMLIFKKMFTAHKSSILRGPVFDAWLKSKKVVLAFPSSRKETKTPPIVPLGELYRDSLELRDEVQLKLDSDKNDDSVDEMYANCRELILPSIIKLYLWRIFSCLAEPMGEEAGTGAVIKQATRALEVELGFSDGESGLPAMLKNLMKEDGFMGNMLKSFGPTIDPMLAKMSLSTSMIKEYIEKFASEEADPTELLAMFIENMDSPIDGEDGGSGDSINSFIAKARHFLSSAKESKLLGGFVDRIKSQIASGTPSSEIFGSLLDDIKDPALREELKRVTDGSVDVEGIYESLSEKAKGFISSVGAVTDSDGKIDYAKIETAAKKLLTDVSETTETATALVSTNTKKENSSKVTRKAVLPPDDE